MASITYRVTQETEVKIQVPVDVVEFAVSPGRVAGTLTPSDPDQRALLPNRRFEILDDVDPQNANAATDLISDILGAQDVIDKIVAAVI